MKRVLLFIGFIFFYTASDAKHITGGEMVYVYLQHSTTTGNPIYRVTLRLFRDENCVGCADMPPTVSIGVFNNDNGSLFGGNYRTVSMASSETLPLNTLPSCITNPPGLVYRVGYYNFNVELPVNTNGYTLAYQTCCRIDNIMNVPNSVGATYMAKINGTAGSNDSSPHFSTGISVVCYDKPFTLDFSATDQNNDSLVYRMCGAFGGGDAMDASFAEPAGPPYSTLPYIGGFSGTFPLGTQASINPATGIISGIAPGVGKYVVSVCVSSYDRVTGAFKGDHRKDFIITVAPCDFAGAQLQPSYLSCDGFTFNFENLNQSPLNVSFFWDFGDGNTSTDAEPTHTYTVANEYQIKLVVNRGGECSDSTYSTLRVFPGYFPKMENNAPMCKDLPVQFRDLTTANYGVANSWRWDFGDPDAIDDISFIKEPTYTYSTPGEYYVELIVGSDKGCIDTIKDTVMIIEKPEFTITNDTLICSVDPLQLNASASSGGTVVWSPAYNINDVNSNTPIVNPQTDTTYYATFTDAFGCTGTDSVVVNVVDSVTMSIRSDTTICRTDPVTLMLNSNALKYEWTPTGTLNDPTLKNPVAIPVDAETTYYVTGRIGSCSDSDSIKVKTVPYPQVTITNHTAICLGNSIPLLATGGSIYEWSPATYLNATNIPNPISQTPASSIQYIVTVRDVLGCPKPVKDTVRITVVKIIANAGPSDTSVVLGQPLQLNATGAEFYEWTPNRWLNNPNISNPIAFPQDNQQYVVKARDAAGCFDTDTINVKLYKVEPDLFVPTAFSPDGDGNNDIFRPIPIGMKSLDAFRVYNRWGQLLYSSTIQNQGWDGKLKGMAQDPGTYVWYAEGVDYRNIRIQRKGYVVLIR